VDGRFSGNGGCDGGERCDVVAFDRSGNAKVACDCQLCFSQCDILASGAALRSVFRGVVAARIAWGGRRVYGVAVSLWRTAVASGVFWRCFLSGDRLPWRSGEGRERFRR
jgi:hypothetical protein